MRLILLGAPGAGKGTHCKPIVEKYNLVHLSSGDILRKERAAGSDLGKEAQTYMDQGALVPDDLIVKMMVSAISKIDAGFVLDGFPRTINQAKELDKALEAADKKIDAILNLLVDDDVVIKRITGRRSCPKCGAVYHIENIKPKTAGVCDVDGEKLTHRSDDIEEVVAKRLATYHELTKPVVGYYKENNKVYDIDSNKDASEVTVGVIEILESLS